MNEFFALGILKVLKKAKYSFTIYSLKFPGSKQINGLLSKITLIDVMSKTKPHSTVMLTR